jgi:hypothetical protein
MHRAFLGVLIAVSFFLMPYVVTVGIAILGVMLFPYYWEIIVLALAFELLYGPSTFSYLSFTAYVPFMALALLLVVEVLRRYFREETLRY